MSAVEVVEKTCTKCHQTKVLEAYARKVGGKYGRQAYCRECDRELSRSYYAEHSEQVQERHRAHYAENRETYREYSREYQIANPHKGWESDYRRRSRAAGHVPVVETFTREELIAYWGNGERCVYCDAPAAEIDHLFPVSLGGQHRLDSVAPSCGSCNRVGGIHVGQYIRTVEALEAEAVELKAGAAEMIEEARARIAA